MATVPKSKKKISKKKQQNQNRVIELGQSSRFHRRRLPERDELVRVEIMRRDEHGFRCKLLEYDGLEGLVLLNQLKRGRVRSLTRILRTGKEYTVSVLKVHVAENEEDTANGSYIDLSKKEVRNEELPDAIARWKKNKKVNDILRHVSYKTSGNVNTEQLYEAFAWPLADIHGSVFKGLRWVMEQEDPRITMTDQGVPAECIESLYQELEKHMAPSPKTLTAIVRMTCFTRHGVQGIQAALAAGLAFDSEQLPITFRVVAAPKFEITCRTMDVDPAKLLIDEVLAAMEVALMDCGGRFEIVEKPKVSDVYDLMAAQDAQAQMDEDQEQGDAEEEEEEA